MKSKKNSVKTLVLIGGHMPHIQSIKRFAENPVENLRIVVITPYSVCPFPPMMADFLSGALEFSKVHLDLQGMCIKAGFTFLSANIESVDYSSKTINLFGRPSVSYDILSIAEFGESVPAFDYDASRLFQLISGHKLIEGWRRFNSQSDEFESVTPPRLAIVGNGSRAAEMAFVLHKVLRKKFKDASIDLLSPTKGFSFSNREKVAETISNALRKIGVQFHTEMEPTSYLKGTLTTKDRKTRNFDYVFWSGEVEPLPWMKASKFKLSEKGKFKTDRFARFAKEDSIFVAGDYAEHLNLKDHYEEIYSENLRRVCLGESSLVEVTGKRSHVNFVHLDGGKVLWIWKKILIKGAFIARIKRRIDVENLSRISEFEAKIGNCAASENYRKVFLDEKWIQNLMKQALEGKHEVSGTIASYSSGLKFKSQGEVALSSNDCLVLDGDFYKWTKILIEQLMTLSMSHGNVAGVFSVRLFAKCGSDEILKEIVAQTLAGVVAVLGEIKSSAFHLDVFASEQSKVEVFLLSNMKPTPKLADHAAVKSGMKIVLTHALGSGTVRKRLNSRDLQGIEVERLIRTSEERDLKLLKFLKSDSVVSIFPLHFVSPKEIVRDVCHNRSLQFCALPESISTIAQNSHVMLESVEEDIAEIKAKDLKKRGIEKAYNEFFSTQWCSGFMLIVKGSDSENLVDSLLNSGFHDAACLGAFTNDGSKTITFK